MIPRKLKFISDDNEIEWQSSDKNGHKYLYTKSIEKLGFVLEVTQEQLDKLIKNKIVEIL